MKPNDENQQVICWIFVVGIMLAVRFISYIAVFGAEKLKIAPF
jgi:hypothetical protein